MATNNEQLVSISTDHRLNHTYKDSRLGEMDADSFVDHWLGQCFRMGKHLPACMFDCMPTI